MLVEKVISAEDKTLVLFKFKSHNLKNALKISTNGSNGPLSIDILMINQKCYINLSNSVFRKF